MSSTTAFLSKFGGGEADEEVSSGPIMLSAGAPHAFGAFMERFTTLTESYFFYGNTIELRFNKEDHKYYKVDPELGNLIPQYGVTETLHIIDKSYALVPWAVKKAAEKLLRTVPVVTRESGMVVPELKLEDFTKLVMEAKDAHREILEDAGDIGHLAHKCLEDSIQHAIDHTEGIVAELRNLPDDEKALACAQAAFAWMTQHHVKWLKTEQKIYSREFEYAGTMDGKCLVSSCDDPSCCMENFTDSLSIADWKSSNALRIEYVLQVAGAYEHAEREEYGEDIQNCFILRLGKNEEEAGKFEPWRIPSKDFPEAFSGFLACLNLVKLIDSVTKRIQVQKKGVREAKKKVKAEQKEIAKMKAKVEKEAERAQKKLDRAAERERIKAEAKLNREEAKRLSKLAVGDRKELATSTTSAVFKSEATEVRSVEVGAESPSEPSASSTVAPETTAETTESTQTLQSIPVCESVRVEPQGISQDAAHNLDAKAGPMAAEESVVASNVYEEEPIIHKPFLVAEES